MNMNTKLKPRSEPITKTLDNIRPLRRILRSQSGQSLVELALLTPILLLLVIGTVEMGRYTSLSILVGNAARAGAEYGAQNPITAGDTNCIQQAAANDVTGTFVSLASPCAKPSLSNWTFSSTFVCGCDNGGTIIPSPETFAACSVACNVGAHLVTSVQVTVTGKFNSMFSYPGIPSPLTISSTATERVAE
jgi:Flp pilus assembly protein TadG